MRDHEAIVIEEFNGWYKRGDADSTPPDHFAEAINIGYIDSGFKTRDGIDPYINSKGGGTSLIVRMYSFDIEGANDGFITLDTNFDFYHVVPNISSTLILHVTNADDFTMVTLVGRAYINPLKDGGLNDFVYVYNGDGTTARKIGGTPPKDADGIMLAAAGVAGTVESGIHIFGVVYETNSGFLTQIGPDTLTVFTAAGATKVDLSIVPVSPNAYVVARHIVATKSINPADYNGNTRGYEFFFVPDGAINDNTTSLITVDFFDSELLESASDLLDIREFVVNGTNLAIYHNRLIVCGQFSGNAQVLVSNIGEYEAFNAVDGLLTVQNDGLGVTAGIEYRDILYIFKINETIAFNDNGEAPSSWPATILDEGLGSAIHGICFVGIRQGTNVEYVMIANYSGIYIFNGTYQKPEYTFKIRDYWVGLDQVMVARRIQLYNDPIKQIIYISLPNEFTILAGDYKNGFDYKNIRWAKRVYDIEPTTITLTKKDNELIIGSDGTVNPNSESII